jgi:hypothetical protein
VSPRKCANCGAAIERHFVCVRCAEGWQSRPYAHYIIECFTDGSTAVIGVNADGRRSPDLLHITAVSNDHPMLRPTMAEFNAIHVRMQAFLGLTTEELETVLDATAKASPELGIKIRRALGRV